MNNQIDTKSLESKLNEICKRCEYHLPFSDHTYDIVKALKRNKNKIFEGYFKKYKNNLAYFERYINKIAKDIFNNGRFNSNVLASSNKYLYNGELITASSKQEAISKITASKESNLDRERLFLEQNGFKFKKQHGDEYAYKRMPDNKHVVVNIYKDDKGIFVVECYIEDKVDTATDCVYDSELREIVSNKRNVRDALLVTDKYFKLVNKYMAIYSELDSKLKEINREARKL